MNEEENPPQLKTASFAVHATRGVIRDRGMRRKAIVMLLACAVVMVLAGSTVLQRVLDPREHGVRFVVYWLACAWVTMTFLLLALFDLLVVRAEGRAARRNLREQLSESDSPEER